MEFRCGETSPHIQWVLWVFCELTSSGHFVPPPVKSLPSDSSCGLLSTFLHSYLFPFQLSSLLHLLTPTELFYIVASTKRTLMTTKSNLPSEPRFWARNILSPGFLSKWIHHILFSQLAGTPASPLNFTSLVFPWLHSLPPMTTALEQAGPTADWFKILPSPLPPAPPPADSHQGAPQLPLLQTATREHPQLPLLQTATREQPNPHSCRQPPGSTSSNVNLMLLPDLPDPFTSTIEGKLLSNGCQTQLWLCFLFTTPFPSPTFLLHPVFWGFLGTSYILILCLCTESPLWEACPSRPLCNCRAPIHPPNSAQTALPLEPFHPPKDHVVTLLSITVLLVSVFSMILGWK